MVKMVDGMVKMIDDKGETSVRILDPCKAAFVIGVHGPGKVQRIMMGDGVTSQEMIEGTARSTVDMLITLSRDSSEKRAKRLAAYMMAFIDAATEMAGTAVMEAVTGLMEDEE